jgi:predicted negative regulator of RcsB-dependent stress response
MSSTDVFGEESEVEMMRRCESLLLIVGLAVTATGAVRAQHPDHHGAAGIRAALLTNESVQRELKLDDSQVERVATLAKEVVARGRAAAEEFKDLAASERREKMHGVMTETCAKAMKTLHEVLTAEQVKRYEQIVLQQLGIMAFADPEIQEKLKLTDAQKERVHEVAMDLHGRMRDLPQSISPEKMAEVHEQALALHRKALDQALTCLSAEQRATWKEMVGKSFEVKLGGHPSPGDRVGTRGSG